MDFEAWWLLIPIAFFALGWFAARVDIRYVLRDARALPSAYFRGLNYLLRQDNDKAVESFVDVSKRDPHALDLQLALGSLFRKQGRVAEATSIHQSLVDRHDLPKDKRELALFELAQDFHASGLFDRAEALYEQLKGSAYEAEATTKLASVLEQEKEWTKVIDARNRIQALSSHPQGRLIAQCHCEIADVALAKNDLAAVATSLREAQSHNRNCGRAKLLAFRAAMRALAPEQGDAKRADAIAALEELVRVQPELIPLVSDEIAALYAGDEAPIAIEQLAAAQRVAPSSIGLSKLIDASIKVEGRERALRRLRAELQRNPSARESARLLELESEEPSNGTNGAAATMKEVAELLRRATDKTPGYHCGHCGFRAPRYYWKCPGCNEWERFKATPLG
jgi:lipopolysaccharide assembly protein B